MRTFLKIIASFIFSFFFGVGIFFIALNYNSLDLSNIKISTKDIPILDYIENNFVTNNVLSLVNDKESLKTLLYQAVYGFDGDFKFSCGYDENECYQDTLSILDGVNNDNTILNKLNSYEVKVSDKTLYITLQFKDEVNKDMANGLAKNEPELIKVLYNQINQGKKEFIITCGYDFNTCLDDLQKNIFVIRDFVSPYYSFSKYEYSYYKNKKDIRLTLTPKLNDDDVLQVRDIISKIIDDSPKFDNEKDKIRYFHDFLVDNTNYDVTCIESTNCDAYSYSIYGLLFNNLAVCEGYAEALQIFLDSLKLPNYRISSNDHAWNYVLLDGKWLYIDATWDDPIGASSTDKYKHRYFLVNEDQMAQSDCSNRTDCLKNQQSHTYDKQKYDYVYEILN